MNNYRITGIFTTRSPLSHISESISTNSYLSQDAILQPDGTIEEVFSYSGNAWRGQLRDLCATYFLKEIGVSVSLDFFHLLYSGGKIGGEQTINIEKAKEIRESVPSFSLFGGGIGSQIISGKIKVGSSYPVCVEALPVLPQSVHSLAKKITYSDLTTEKNFTRMDDSKKLDLIDNIKFDDLHLLSDEERKKKKDVATQMIMTSELVIPGVQLTHQIDLMSVNDIELGALFAAFKMFSELPYVGGQSNKGHGLVDYECFIVNTQTNENYDVIRMNSSSTHLSSFAEEKIDSYQKHLMEIKANIKTSKIGKIMGV
ncbi:hypothetical protein [uncultured Gilliamella sp.]|uniref:hypothetical protein n=1 Tax=uncultured Gilliamella sp. TaxID=1193505 RepID=UPI0025F749D4|nr:hypothetical protein [uncultured Gilliamella sp.]